MIRRVYPWGVRSVQVQERGGAEQVLQQGGGGQAPALGLPLLPRRGLPPGRAPAPAVICRFDCTIRVQADRPDPAQPDRAGPARSGGKSWPAVNDLLPKLLRSSLANVRRPIRAILSQARPSSQNGPGLNSGTVLMKGPC